MRRWSWLAEEVKKHDWRFGAELGVKWGQTLFYLLENCPRLHMIGVDVWDFVQWEKGDVFASYDHAGNEAEVRRRITDFPGRVKLYKCCTVEAAPFVEDGTLDFVFIDACHETKSVKADILAWAPKVKAGGMLCGHDAGKQSVRVALDELFPNWKMLPHDKCWKC